MYKSLKIIFSLLTVRDKIKFFILIPLLFFVTIFEIIGLALILPFLIFVGNLDLINTNKYIHEIYLYFKFTTQIDFLSAVGFSAIFFIVLGTLLAIFTNLKLLNFSSKVGITISNKIFNYYIYECDEKLIIDNKKEIIKKILSDSILIGSGIIYPLINVISKSILICFLFAILLFVNLEISLSIIVIAVLFYYVSYKLSIKVTSNNLVMINENKVKKATIVSGTLTNIDNLTDKEKDMQSKLYINKLNAFSKKSNINTVIGKVPKYFMTLLVFSSIIIIIMYLVRLEELDIHSLMSNIIIFVIVGLKMLPQTQNVFVNYLKLKSSLVHVKNIKEELNIVGKK